MRHRGLPLGAAEQIPAALPQMRSLRCSGMLSDNVRQVEYGFLTSAPPAPSARNGDGIAASRKRASNSATTASTLPAGGGARMSHHKVSTGTYLPSQIAKSGPFANELNAEQYAE
jgi:hypothetical protein